MKAVSRSLGQAQFKSYYYGAQPYTPVSGPAHDAYISSLHKDSSQVQKPVAQWESDPYSQSAWDSIILMALAMEKAKSTSPSVYNRVIPQIADGGPGATVVHDFATGKAAILAGKPITFVGATGPITFDRYHNSPGGFAVVRSDGSTVTVFSSAALQTLR